MRVSGKAYTSELPFGEREMYEHTAVPTDILNQRWDHGIWIGDAPMTDECIILTESGILKAQSSRLTSGSLAKTSKLIRSLRDDEGEVTGTRDAQVVCAFTMRANGRS